MNATPNAKRIHARILGLGQPPATGGFSVLALSTLLDMPAQSVRRALYEHSAFRRDRTRPWLFLARDVSPAASATGIREIRWTAPPASYLQRLVEVSRGEARA